MEKGKLSSDPANPNNNRNDKRFYIPVTFYKNAGNTGRNFHPEDKDSTGLLEFSLMNKPFFGVIHCGKHLDKKLDYTISQIFQEMSLCEMETLHHLCELERTLMLQSFALAVFKTPYAGYPF